MLALTDAQLTAFANAFLFPLARILALVAAAPVLNNRAIPARLKIGLGALLAVLVAPLAGPMPDASPFSAAGLGLLAEQLAIGAAIGFVMRLVFAAVDLAGDLAGLQMGLGFAAFYDPQNAASTPLVAQFLNLCATLAFVALDGHLLLVALLAESFRQLPVGAGLPGGSAWEGLLAWTGVVFRAGLGLALPVLAFLLAINIALGILSRAAPQLNLFSIGFPLTLLAGLFALGAAMPYFIAGFGELVGEAQSVLAGLLSR